MLLHITLPKKDPFNGGNSCNREGDYSFILLSPVHFKPKVFVFNAASFILWINSILFVCCSYCFWNLHSYIDSIFVPISCNENKILNESKKIDQFNLVFVFYVQCLFVICSSFSCRYGSHPHHLLGRRELLLCPVKRVISYQ